MVEKIERIGRFTSSNIWKLTTLAKDGKSFGAPALTYIEEKRAERTLGRSIDLGKQSQSTIWGKVMEYYCDKFHLGLEYSLCSNETVVHPKYRFWSGSPDVKKSNTIGDIKCFEPKRFYEFTMNLIKLNEGIITIDDFKKEEKEIYWQVVSNCLLTNKSKGEFISYTPTERQISQIREEWETDNYAESLGETLAEHLGVDFLSFHYFINKELYYLPYIPNGIKFPNFMSYEFDIPADDVIFLTKKVLEAEKKLNEK